MSFFSKFCRPGVLVALALVLPACGQKETTTGTAVETPAASAPAIAGPVLAPRPDVYASFALRADVTALSDSQKEMIRLMIEASGIMDDLFWRQAFRD
ncbi:MAG: hypothetical protein KDI09_06490, partial [Halioglobus sp.]|nr:hypothetical protein [Halioglobus sp.]